MFVAVGKQAKTKRLKYLTRGNNADITKVNYFTKLRNH